MHFDYFNAGEKILAVDLLGCVRQAAGLTNQPSLEGSQSQPNDGGPKLSRPDFSRDLAYQRKPSLLGRESVLHNKRDLGVVAVFDDLDHAICPCDEFRSVQQKADSQFAFLHVFCWQSYLTVIAAK